MINVKPLSEETFDSFHLIDFEFGYMNLINLYVIGDMCEGVIQVLHVKKSNNLTVLRVCCRLES